MIVDYDFKYKKLVSYLQELNTVAVAFSAGVDSTFLLKVAHDVLLDNAIAVTVNSFSFPNREFNQALEFCKKENIKHFIVNYDELNIKGFSQNPKNRCYLCKKELFSKILEIANQNKIENVVEGSNIDDNNDYRPGFQAIKELNIKSPLQYAGFTKEEIRGLSEKLNLPSWNKPSFACLASRFAWGEEITKEKLIMVDKAEQLLFELGFKQFRVRIHGKMARIEILPDEFTNLINKETREKIVSEFKNYGFTYVSMDLSGYRTGSMNEIL